MSGGVDSSVACLLLRQKGYDVVGLTMKLLPNPESGDLPRAPCCTLDMAEDARRICAVLGIPHYTLNMVSEFEEGVIEPFIRDYAAGRTPNPCLRCNKVMKFGWLWTKAREIDAQFIATGHYARSGRRGSDGEWVDNCEVANTEGYAAAAGATSGSDVPPDAVTESGGERALLLKGADRSKDQSYALYGLTQGELAHAMFPLGSLTKKEVRQIAREAGLATAEKPESQEICFVTSTYREFLAGRGIDPEPGPIVDTSGRVLGRHVGVAFYTVGQRRGLGVSGGRPLYVVDLDLDRNAVIVGNKQEACSPGCFVEDLNLIAAGSLDGPVEGTCMVRYRGKETAARMSPVGDVDRTGEATATSRCEPAGRHRPAAARFDFAAPQFAATPGQAAVLYQGDLVFGGGVITGRVRGSDGVD